MYVSCERLGVRGENVVCDVTDVAELISDRVTELINQLVAVVGETAKHTDLHRDEKC